jgi:hypothetical protein
MNTLTRDEAHSEAGCIFADCSRRIRFFLQFGGGPYMFRQLRPSYCIRSKNRVRPLVDP